jgi:outer membrane protein assembly factor BamE
MRPLSIAVLCSLLLAATACSFSLPRVHKVTVQQGNVITQEMIDRLKPGMTRSQVAFVMGEPVVRNSFDDDRWDYIYSLEIPGYYNEQKRVSVYFENGVLAYFTGDYAPSAIVEEAEQTTASTATEPEERNL